jgi:hypothetical protein
LEQSNQALTEQNTELAQRLEKLESTPMGRKSATNPQAMESFAKSQ